MTTPERFRRRQRIEGWFVLILGVATILMGIYFHGEDRRQKACFADTIHDLTVSIKAGRHLTNQQFEAIGSVLGRGLSATTQAEFEAVKRDYFRTSAKINRERAEHPIPPFPKGACE